MFVVIDTKKQNAKYVGCVDQCFRDARDAVVYCQCRDNEYRRRSNSYRNSYFPIVWWGRNQHDQGTQVPWVGDEVAHLPEPVAKYCEEAKLFLVPAVKELGIPLRELQYETAHWAFVVSYLRSHVDPFHTTYLCPVCNKSFSEFDEALGCHGKLPEPECEPGGDATAEEWWCPFCGMSYPTEPEADNCCLMEKPDAEETQRDMQRMREKVQSRRRVRRRRVDTR